MVNEKTNGDCYRNRLFTGYIYVKLLEIKKKKKEKGKTASSLYILTETKFGSWEGLNVSNIASTIGWVSCRWFDDTTSYKKISDEDEVFQFGSPTTI